MLFLLSGFLLILSSDFATLITSEKNSSSFKTVQTSNAAILNRLGLTSVQISGGHHKKRLAGPEPTLGSQTFLHQPYSRQHGPRDSHIYIVKLPASPPYYTIAKPYKSVNNDKVTKISSNIPIGFQGNGKPVKIYHWNLPIIKKVIEKKRLNQLRIDQTWKKLKDIKKQQTFSKPILTKLCPFDMISYEYYGLKNKLCLYQKHLITKNVRNNDKRLNYPINNNDTKFELMKNGNNTDNKTYGLNDLSMHRIYLINELYGSRNTVPKMKKYRKKATMLYYAPIAKTGSTSIHKNFSGNGKPNAFYIMEKSRKPAYYHPLLP